MLVFTAALGSLSLLSDFTITTTSSATSSHNSYLPTPLNFSCRRPLTLFKVSLSSDNSSITTSSDDVIQQSFETLKQPSLSTDTTTTTSQQFLSAATEEDDIKLDRKKRSADWIEAKRYLAQGLIYEGKVEGYNLGGLLIKFHSILGFLPFPQIGPLYKCKAPRKSMQKIARDLTGSTISVKVIHVEPGRRLVLSEREANWTKFSPQLRVGDIYDGRVGSVEDYGAFVHIRFPDGGYYLTGLVHISEVSWDLLQDVRDILTEGDQVRVKVLSIDKVKSRFTLSIKQLEEDPLLETLDKVIPKDSTLDPSIVNGSEPFAIEPLPGLDTIIQELLFEDGINKVKITRQGFEKRVVSQDLQLWLSNAPPIGDQYTLLARAGRQVQEIQLTTSLGQDGIKRALQRVLERVP